MTFFFLLWTLLSFNNIMSDCRIIGQFCSRQHCLTDWSLYCVTATDTLICKNISSFKSCLFYPVVWAETALYKNDQTPVNSITQSETERGCRQFVSAFRSKIASLPHHHYHHQYVIQWNDMYNSWKLCIMMFCNYYRCNNTCNVLYLISIATTIVYSSRKMSFIPTVSLNIFSLQRKMTYRI